MGNSFELRDGGMNIFPNGYKQKDNQPDYTGKAKIDGKDKQVSCWIKQGMNGEYFSCQVQDPYVRPEAQQSHVQPTHDEAGNELNPNYNLNVKPNNDFDDDIPF